MSGRNNVNLLKLVWEKNREITSSELNYGGFQPFETTVLHCTVQSAKQDLVRLFPLLEPTILEPSEGFPR